jgi:predicted dehydrogenase
MERPVNWGILSAGLIARDFAYALKLNCPNAVVYAVGARSQERANEFGEKLGCKKCYASYEALAEDPDVGMHCVLLISAPIF